MRLRSSFHKPVDGGTEVFDGVFVAGGNRVHHAVAHMVLQNHLAGVVQGRADSSQLHQDFRTVVTLFHHPLHLLQVADGPCQTVDHGFLILVDMAVGMGNAMGMMPGVVVFVVMVMMMVIVSMAVRMVVLMFMFMEMLMVCGHSHTPLSFG